MRSEKRGAMNFCSKCGSRVKKAMPDGDDRERHICESCGKVHYRNPTMVVACIPEWGDRILLARRAIEPRRGYWTIPGGFLELGETVSEGAARETLEEAGARVEIVQLYTVFNLTRYGQVYLIFRARLLDDRWRPGEESLELALFEEKDIPWPDMAFSVVSESLKMYFRDRAAGEFPIRLGSIPSGD